MKTAWSIAVVMHRACLITDKIQQEQFTLIDCYNGTMINTMNFAENTLVTKGNIGTTDNLKR